MRLTFAKFDQVSEPAGAGGSADNENTKPEETQTAPANISKSEDSNIPPLQADGESWRGDERYYQQGAKAGTLKAKYRTPEQNATVKRLGFKALFGKPRELTGADHKTETGGALEGLKIDELRASAPGSAQQSAPVTEQSTKAKQTKAEKKLVEAKTGAKLAMRMLDTLVMWISKGQYGRDFSPEQRLARNEYREALEKDWEDYLVTLDIPMHPGLVVAFGSMMYAADAFNTQAGQERAQTFKEKIGAKIGAFIFSRKG